MDNKKLFQVRYVDVEEVRLCVAHNENEVIQFVADRIDVHVSLVQSWINRGEIVIDNLNVPLLPSIKSGELFPFVKVKRY